MRGFLAVRGLGLVGGFGCGAEALGAALAAGAPPPARRADPEPLDRFLPRRTLRRVDHFSRLALLGAHLALEDAGLLGGDRSRLGVVVATGYGPSATTFGFLDSVLDGGDACASPTLFSNSVHNAAAAHLSIALGATGPCLTVSQFETSVASALLSAAGWLAEGRVDAVLFGGVDEAGPVLAYCWERFFGADAAARPGEGAGFLVLRRAEDAGPGDPVIEGVEVGNLRAGPPRLPSGALVVSGADGTPRCGPGYRAAVPPGTPEVRLAPLFGSFPAAGALELAAAVWGLRQGGVALPPWLGPAAALGAGPVACLRVGADGEFGLIAARGAG